jgi:hypothetical protein
MLWSKLQQLLAACDTTCGVFDIGHVCTATDKLALGRPTKGRDPPAVTAAQTLIIAKVPPATPAIIPS